MATPQVISTRSSRTRSTAMGSVLQCLRHCLEDEEDNEEEPHITVPNNNDPPRPMDRAAGDEGGGGQCCIPSDSPPPWTQFWHKLTKSKYQHIQHDIDSPLDSSPESASPNHRVGCNHSNNIHKSPLRTAHSFDSSRDDILTIRMEEIVLPGSALQHAMALKMCESLESPDYDECVICMEGFSKNNPRMPTLCGCGANKTFFHLPCLYQWREHSDDCPSCRQRIAWEEFWQVYNAAAAFWRERVYN